MKVIPCKTCGGQMVRKKISSGNFIGLIGAVIVLVLGLVITIAIPVLGWVVGPLMMLMSLGMGGKRQKVWRCRNCKAFVPRA